MSGGVCIHGGRVRGLREARFLSRKELAEKAGVGYSTLANLESGFVKRPRPETIRALASVLGVKPQSISRPAQRR